MLSNAASFMSLHGNTRTWAEVTNTFKKKKKVGMHSGIHAKTSRINVQQLTICWYVPMSEAEPAVSVIFHVLLRSGSASSTCSKWHFPLSC